MLGDSKAVRNAAFYTELEINGKTDLICKLEELFEKRMRNFVDIGKSLDINILQC